MKTAVSRPPARSADESKRIETQSACTNVPKPRVTVGDALAVLQTAAKRQGDARQLRRAVLEVLTAIDDPE